MYVPAWVSRIKKQTLICTSLTLTLLKLDIRPPKLFYCKFDDHKKVLFTFSLSGLVVAA